MQHCSVELKWFTFTKFQKPGRKLSNRIMELHGGEIETREVGEQQAAWTPTVNFMYLQWPCRQPTSLIVIIIAAQRYHENHHEGLKMQPEHRTCRCFLKWLTFFKYPAAVLSAHELSRVYTRSSWPRKTPTWKYWQSPRKEQFEHIMCR